MNKLSETQEERARKNNTIILQRLASVGNKPVAHALGCDESTISRMRAEKIQELATMLAVLDLKVVPVDMRCFKQSDVEFFMYGSKKWHERLQSADDLWDDEY